MSGSLQDCGQDKNLVGTETTNVVLFHHDIPVISVERGTTLGLTKKLYESIGGHGDLIGLRRRHNSSTVSSIVTQNHTALSELEYDIILHGGSSLRKRNMDGRTANYQERAVNTYISFDPLAHVWWADSFPHRHRFWKGEWSACLQNATNDGSCWQEEKDGLDDSREGLKHRLDTQTEQNMVPLWNALECKVKEKESRMDYCDRVAPVEDRTGGVSSGFESTSPSTGDAESRSGSNEDSPSSQPKETRGTPRRKWKCVYCEKLFVCRSAYDNHERIHTGEKPFRCSVCGRCFAHEGNLKQHSHIHRDVKPHVCDICGRGFTRSNRLRDHKRSHSEYAHELQMRAKIQWTPAQKVVSGRRGGVAVVDRCEETVTSDENQEDL